MDKLARDMIAAALRSTADALSKDHFGALTQEHQLTSRLAEGLERSQLNGLDVLGDWVSITTQEFPDKGAGALEHKTGVDLYVGVNVLETNGFSKGFFVQSKWKALGRPTKDRNDLRRQCEGMLEISPWSYVWLYGPDGIEVVRARDVVDLPHMQPEQLSPRNVGDTFGQVLACNEGDPLWAVPEGPGKRMRLAKLLADLTVHRALSFTIAPTRRRPRRF
ncbi:hypothetical protein MesoLjLc_37740 [Mesorhizobium sp. L-8-10]|uniref:hypothetical protein n=1 Tax=Mesorhizobium sp. L-8-10 TaxID=2744523 RepID=UPI001927C77F|nr:hypothetical protein [Mesorhizobium sp. L-8-10]BCH31844.1 hypothetical protein MesoLjLc_37740 [Mesorhizobium sp. L-8-10]